MRNPASHTQFTGGEQVPAQNLQLEGHHLVSMCQSAELQSQTLKRPSLMSCQCVPHEQWSFMEEDDLPYIMRKKKYLNSHYTFNHCLSNFFTLPDLHPNPVQTRTYTCGAQTNLLTVLILTICTLIFSILPCFLKCQLQSTALTALVDCDSGLEKHCTAFLPSEGQRKGNIMIREVNGLSLTQPQGKICCRPKTEQYEVECIGNIISYKLGRLGAMQSTRLFALLWKNLTQ